MTLFLRFGGLLLTLMVAQGVRSEPREIIADTTTVAWVDGEPIVVAELKRAFRWERAATYARFQAAVVASGHVDFWKSQVGGETALEHIRARARARLVDQKVQQIMMRHRGLWDDFSDAAFRAALQSENTRRQRAIAAGKVVHGPIVYSSDTYFNYLFGNALIRLKAKLAEGELRANEKALRRFYDERKHREFNRGPCVDVLVIEIPVTGALDDAEKRARVVQAELASGAEFASVAIKFQLGKEATRRSYRQSDLNLGKLEVDPWAQAALKLRVGEISPPVPGNSSLAILRAVARRNLDLAPYDDVEEEVRIRYLDWQFAEEVKKRAAAADVSMTPEWAQVMPD